MQARVIKDHKILSKKFIILIVLFLLIFSAFAAASTWFNWSTGEVDKSGKEKVFVVNLGESTSSIGQRLEKDGLVHSGLFFWLYTRFSCNGVTLTNPLSFIKKPSSSKDCLSGQIQAGTFQLSAANNLDKIALQLTKGKPVDKWTKIIEGLRVEEIADKLFGQYNFPPGDYLKVAKEGYMFPDTYLFRTESTADEIAAKMRENFDKKFTAEIQSGITKQGLSLNEGITLASIVQREAGHADDAPLIASVFLNRLNIHMPLGSDVTVQYALGYDEAEKTWWKKDLTPDDLAIDSPYNTRLYAGLPPNPICNPGLAAIKAVATPATSDYYYFLYDKDGNVHFAKTLDEHNSNKQKYL